MVIITGKKIGILITTGNVIINKNSPLMLNTIGKDSLAVLRNGQPIVTIADS